MSIEVTRLDASERDEWNRYVERTTEAMPFHRYEALDVIADAADTELHLLVGFKGQEPVGLFPVFHESQGPMGSLEFVYSPPTKVEIPYLGPLLLDSGEMKQRKAEKYHRRFIEGCIDWIDDRLNPDLVDVRTTDRYPDARPFVWNDFDVRPAYTYVLDLVPDEAALLEQFSRTPRKTITSVDEDAYTVTEGGEAEIRQIVRHLHRLYEGFDDDFEGITEQFAIDLYEALPEGRMRPYVINVDGDYAGGGLTVESDNTLYRWRGSATSEVDFPVNDVLHWEIMCQAADRGLARYDLVGGMEPRLCEYKAKFSPDPRLLHVATRKSRRMAMLSSLYHRVPSEVKTTLGV